MTERKAIVLYKDQIAGSLEETASGGTRFVYAPDWQEDIACCFPIARREHEWARGLHPFFEHLGTEGWLREQQARSAQIADEDDFGLLLRYAADCIGAVSVKPVEEKGPDAPVNDAAVSPGRTISGVQKKLLVTKGSDGRFYPAHADGPAPFIAKFNSEAHADLVRNERLSLDWCRAILGDHEVNAATTAQIETLGERALLVTRFDRTAEGKKLRLEDFAQILAKPRGRDYAGKYDAGYEEIASAIDKHSARPAIDKARFLQRLIVFVIVGNCDAHLKNFSLLETLQGLRLSPAYDILNTALYERFDQQLALRIDGRKVQLGRVDQKLLRDFGLSIGLSAKAVEQAFKDIARKAKSARARDIITPPEGEPPDGFFHRYREVVDNACLRILI